LILQGTEWPRFLAILITQSFIIIFFFYLAFKVLKRNLNRITLTLSLFYILIGIGFILNIIFLLFCSTSAGYFIYFIAAYLIHLGAIFLIIFIMDLFETDPYYNSKKQFLIIFSYALIIFLILNIPGGITINEYTNWTPVFSWLFLILMYLTITFIIFIPSIMLSIKLYNRFEDKNLKRKFMYFFIGMSGMFMSYYGLILFNTWDDPIFKIIWSFLSLIVIPSGLLIYYGIGHNL